MRSNEIKKKPRGKSKSCGADFYDMPELERPESLARTISAGFANSRNAVIRPSPGRSSLFRVLRWACLRALLFNLTKPWRQVIQRRLSVADRCRECSQLCAR